MQQLVELAERCRGWCTEKALGCEQLEMVGAEPHVHAHACHAHSYIPSNMPRRSARYLATNPYQPLALLLALWQLAATRTPVWTALLEALTSAHALVDEHFVLQPAKQSKDDSTSTGKGRGESGMYVGMEAEFHKDEEQLYIRAIGVSAAPSGNGCARLGQPDASATLPCVSPALRSLASSPGPVHRHVQRPGGLAGTPPLAPAHTPLTS